jgi:hypothetical protein
VPCLFSAIGCLVCSPHLFVTFSILPNHIYLHQMMVFGFLHHV